MDQNDEYSVVAKGRLKLRCSSEIKKKNKKKKSKDSEKVEKVLEEHATHSSIAGSDNTNNSSIRVLTKAEISFKQQQEKMQKIRILEKATTTHKQRVEKFNEHLDSLTEHFDIPKVSWTK